MSNPWDVIVPEKGDDTREVTAAAKGEATSCWELSEVRLSRLFSAVCCNGLNDEVAAKAYGIPINFQERLNRLEGAGHAFFRARCDQALEADFEDVIQLARMLSLRRNEIVHSIIRGVEYSRSARREGTTRIITVKLRFFLVPPEYTDRKFDEHRRPEFIYSSNEIDQYHDWFQTMGTAALSLAIRLSGMPLEPFGRRHPEQRT